VWRDDEVGVLAARDGDRDGWGQAASRAPAVDDLPNGASVNGVARDGLDESFLELSGAGAIEDDEQASGGVPDVAAALGHEAKERLTAPSRASESIQAAVLAGAAFLIDETLKVLRLLELLSAVPAANMRSDDLVSFGDADFVEVGVDDEGALDAVVRD
jgi:hypothetical protein